MLCFVLEMVLAICTGMHFEYKVYKHFHHFYSVFIAIAAWLCKHMFMLVCIVDRISFRSFIFLYKWVILGLIEGQTSSRVQFWLLRLKPNFDTFILIWFLVFPTVYPIWQYEILYFLIFCLRVHLKTYFFAI